MKRFLTAALMAAFFATGISGCYTKLKGPEPGTGEELYRYYGYYPYDYDSYWGYYYDNYCYRWGWFNPYLFGYSGYYDFFYSPWWFDPWYGYDGGRTSEKSLRYRRVNTDPSPGGYSYPLPTNPGGDGIMITKPVRTGEPADGQRPSAEPDRSSGKATRGRR